MEGPNERFVVGLIGAGIGSSLSPPIHEHEADRWGLRYLYQLIDIDRLGLVSTDVGDLVTQARRLGFRGLNITHPCKQEVVKHLDELSTEATELGAVNTVVFTGDRSVGHNTDRYGFAEGFVRGLPDARIDDVVLIGAGGAGTAVAYAMVRLGVGRLTVVDAEPERARRLVNALAKRVGAAYPDNDGPIVMPDTRDNLAGRLAGCDGLINATPVGMEAHPGAPVSPELLRPGMWVADIIYRPLETDLLRQARDRGCRTLHGGGMVVYQAAEAFRLFTGRTPDAGRMFQDFTTFAERGA
jgi:shikimate dehydrogenase